MDTAPLSSTALGQAAAAVQVDVSVLHAANNLEKELVDRLFQSLGVGTNVNANA